MFNMTHATGVRLYRKTGEFSHDSSIRHIGEQVAAKDANYIANHPQLYENYISPMPTNIYVRDLRTGRFVKWRN